MTNGFSGQMWEPFAQWVATEHPDDVAAMYQNASQTEPLLTEDSIRLWARRVPEYVADVNRVAFIGLPPEGATPSTPERGELVVEFLCCQGGTEGLPNLILVYADGRLIWERQGDLPEGANEFDTGLLEQRLTPEGVELIRSEVLSARLPEQNPECFTGTRVRDRGRLVTIGVCGGETLTQAQIDALSGLDDRLYDVASWLPESAWEDRTIRGYVPSRFQVCMPRPEGAPFLEFQSLLPAHAVEAARHRLWMH